MATRRSSLTLSRRSEDPHWFHFVPTICCSSFEAPLADALRRLSFTPAESDSNLQYDVTHVLRDIPAADAWGLLSRHWGVLKHRPQFIAIALYCGTPESTRFATDAVAQFGAADLSFLDIESTFAFMDSSRAHKLNGKRQRNPSVHPPELVVDCKGGRTTRAGDKQWTAAESCRGRTVG